MRWNSCATRTDASNANAACSLVGLPIPVHVLVVPVRVFCPLHGATGTSGTPLDAGRIGIGMRIGVRIRIDSELASVPVPGVVL